MIILNHRDSDIHWRKSTHSDGSQNCVESALFGAAALIRDTKRIDGGLLKVSAEAWTTFLDRVR